MMKDFLIIGVTRARANGVNRKVLHHPSAEAVKGSKRVAYPAARRVAAAAAERPATARTRRYRERLRAGAVMVPIAVSPEILGLLIDTGWLSESESEDRRQIAAALGALLADAAAHHRR
jgi:hypothetical protein